MKVIKKVNLEGKLYYDDVNSAEIAVKALNPDNNVSPPMKITLYANNNELKLEIDNCPSLETLVSTLKE